MDHLGDFKCLLQITRGWTGTDGNRRDDGRGMDICQLSGETKFSDPWTFFCDRGSKRRRGEMATMGLSPEKQSWMKFVHFKNASLQIEYS